MDVWGRDATAVADKLRVLAIRIEDGTLGALSLNTLGEIFGNEFWNLIVHENNRDLLERIARALEFQVGHCGS